MGISLILCILVKHILRWRLLHIGLPLVAFLVIAQPFLHHIIITVLLCKVASKISICLSSLFVYGDDLLLLLPPLLTINVICIQTLTFCILHVRVQCQLSIERCQLSCSILGVLRLDLYAPSGFVFPYMSACNVQIVLWVTTQCLELLLVHESHCFQIFFSSE
jgi:hypothetical protein